MAVVADSGAIVAEGSVDLCRTAAPEVPVRDLGTRSGEPTDEPKGLNPWIIASLGIVAVIVAVGLWLVLGRGEAHQPPTASLAPVSEATVPTTALPPDEPTSARRAPSAAAAKTLPTNAFDPPLTGGSVWVRTPSGKTLCQILVFEDQRPHEPARTDKVACVVESSYPAPACCVSVEADGEFNWFNGNAGNPDFVTLEYGIAYHALGWTIEPTPDGTTFTNDSTGHGMFVSVEGVEAF